jgi:hypothetical protein
MLILLGSNKLPFPTHSFAHRIPTGQRITRCCKGSFDATSPVVIRKRVRSIRVRFIHVVLDRRLFGRHSGGLVLSLYRGSRFGLSRPAGPQKPNGFQRMPWSCTPKFTRVSETRCPMKLRTAGRSAPCGSGYAIWIAKILVARILSTDRSRNGFERGFGDPAHRRLDSRLLTDRHKSVGRASPARLLVAFWLCS